MRENDGGGDSNPGYTVNIYGNVIMKPPVQLIHANKIFFF
jgi:hypothetical protein